jgi:hypothetical protein
MGIIKKTFGVLMLVFFVTALAGAASACNYNDREDNCDCEEHHGYHDNCDSNCYDDNDDCDYNNGGYCDDDNCDNDDCYKYKAYENTKYVSFDKYQC